MNLNKKLWTGLLKTKPYDKHSEETEKSLELLKNMVQQFTNQIKSEKNKTLEECQMDIVGKVNPHKHLESDVQKIMGDNILQCLNTMINQIAF